MKPALITLLVVLGLIILSATCYTCNKMRENVTDGAFIEYENFQETYNTCMKLNTDLCNMKALPDTDKMFDQFSKAQRINTLRTQLNRWVEDYNGKSKMWNKALWKSSTLPYQLSVNQFSCY